MTLTNQNFTMIAGDDQDIIVTDIKGVSFSGSTINWYLKQGNTVLSKSTSNGIAISGSTFTVSLTSADTASLSGKYHHVVKVTDVLGKTKTAMTGDITIERE